MFKVVKKSAAQVRKLAENKSANNYITKDIFPGVSLATIEATDYSEQETTQYNRIYYVLSGTLQLIFGNESVELSEGDSCFVEKNTTYTLSGTFKTIVVNQPAFGA